MTLAYQDDWLTIYGGDCRTVLAELPDESVHTVVTSPPYWGLRDYGTATWEGGEDGCDHTAAKKKTRYDYGLDSSAIQQGSRTGTDAQAGMYAASCPSCGAVRIDSQLGLEPTPEQYVENMVAVFREVRRVLRSDGTVWLNLGDSYYTSPAGNTTPSGISQNTAKRAGKLAEYNTQPKTYPGLKPKDLVGIPWRVAFALQADGWYLRSDIIWSKPNPMPESVTDRPTKSHEYVFLLAKSPRYYFDADAVREGSLTFGRQGRSESIQPKQAAVAATGARNDPGLRDDFSRSQRNIRTVWTVATQPYPGAHFAVFPEKLIEPCILAGTSERGVCPECGKPWRRDVERQGVPRDVFPSSTARRPGDDANDARTANGGMSNGTPVALTVGWSPPDCEHRDRYTGLHAEPVPAVVLDPFGGSGTTARVANRLSRRAVLIDLNPEYLKQQMDRNRDIPLGLGA